MGNPKHLIILLILCGTIFYSCCQDDIAYKQLGCVTNEDCVSCHHAAEYCNWCEDYNFNLKSTNPSCNVWESLIADGCPEDRILKSKRSYSFVNEDKPLMDMTSSDTNSGNQIRPQKMTITLKPGETRTISFEYRLAKNYPLDLYYLMDLTWSMRDDKITLVGLKDELPIAIKKLTDHFRLGFGSFADKPLMPYTAMDERHRQNPCAFELGACDPTYTFQHSLSLTHKAGDFISVVNETKVTANLDNTEAAMEALVQVIQCKEEIGWADDSRKIVIIATDGLVHFAGLGKLGGVVKPNDEKCYLNNNGFYTQSTVMDFPSLGQIDRILKENKVNVIFAVTEDVKNEYVKLNELLPENTYVGRLEANSSNILSLVKQGYEDFVSVISFSDNSVDPLKITYFSDCGSNGSVVETSKCENVEIGKTYKFYVNISIESCPEHSHRKVKTIEISEAQIGKKALTIDVDLHCECECNAKPDELEYSSNCPTNAKLVCGKCKCLTGWMGPDCSCNMKDAELEVLPDATCVGTEGTGICSGAGDCLCGACLCDRGFTGAHCECRECDRDPSNGLVCGGPTRGRCDCGNCVCAAGLTGATCSCPLSQERCILPGDTTVCSGRGECKCGECQCSSSEGLRYAGKFCETCTNCENSVCRLYEDCARAAALGAPTDGVCADKGALYIPTVLEDYATPPENASLCVFRHTEGNSNCDYPFTYEVQRDWTVRVTVYPRTCIDYIQRAMFGGVAMFLSILLLGILALLCVKGVTVVRDKRAYARFLAERDLHLENLGENQQNPLYRSPVSRFTMPDDYNRAKKD